MEIKIRGNLSLTDIWKALHEKLHEVQTDYAIKFSRGATLYINPTNEFGDDVVPRGQSGIAGDAPLGVRFFDADGRAAAAPIDGSEVAGTAKGILVLRSVDGAPQVAALDAPGAAPRPLLTRDGLASDPRAADASSGRPESGTMSGLAAAPDGAFGTVRLQMIGFSAARSYVVVFDAAGRVVRFVRADDLTDLAWSPVGDLVGYTIDRGQPSERAAIVAEREAGEGGARIRIDMRGALPGEVRKEHEPVGARRDGGRVLLDLREVVGVARHLHEPWQRAPRARERTAADEQTGCRRGPGGETVCAEGPVPRERDAARGAAEIERDSKYRVAPQPKMASTQAGEATAALPALKPQAGLPQKPARAGAVLGAKQLRQPRILYKVCPLCDSKEIARFKEADCSKHPIYQPILPPTMVCEPTACSLPWRGDATVPCPRRSRKPSSVVRGLFVLRVLDIPSPITRS